MTEMTLKSLLDRADALIDDDRLEEAAAHCRDVLARDPRHLLATHWLNWTLDELLARDPERADAAAMRAEQRAARQRVLEQTAELDEPDDTRRRARALALVQGAKQRIASGYLAEIDAAIAEIEEALRLRDVDVFRTEMLRARARRALLLARAGDADEGYGQLLAMTVEQPDSPAVGEALEDTAYLAWLEARPADPSGAAGLDEALLRAAGKGAHAALNHLVVDPGRVGRVGRIAGLVKLGADVNTRSDYDGSTPIHFAAAVGDVAALEALARRGADIDARDEEGKSPLHRAAEMHRADTITALARLGAVIDARDRDGRTALHEAAFSADAQTVAALGGGGADVGATDEHGTTPLHLAARVCNRTTVAELLARGADAGRKDEQGKTPLDEALEQGHGELAELLGAEPSDAGALPLQELLEGLPAEREALLADPLFEDDSTAGLESLLRACLQRGPRSWHEVAPMLQLGRSPTDAYAVVWLARRLLRRSPAEELQRPGGFYLGDVTVRGELRLAGALLVAGDLVVEGVLSDAGPDSLLVVGGSVRARGLSTDGEARVGGDLEAELVYGAYNDNSLIVGGELRAEVLIEDDHDVRCHGGLRVAHRFPLGDYSSSDPVLAELFVDEVFSEEEGQQRLDRHRLFARLGAGKPVLRDQRRPRPTPRPRPKPAPKPKPKARPKPKPRPKPKVRPKPKARRKSPTRTPRRRGR
jgi:ankyrin repeat protein